VEGRAEVAAEGATVGEVLRAAAAAYPGFGPAVFEVSGGLRRFLNVFLGDEDVRYLQGLDTPVPDGVVLVILPAAAGGSGAGDAGPAAGGIETPLEVTPGELANRPLGSVQVIDMRLPGDLALGAIPGSCWVGPDGVEAGVAALFPDTGTEIVLYCAAGIRSLVAAQALRARGYRRAVSLAGGMMRWKAEGRKVEVPVGRPAASRARYSRQVLLSEVGRAGQERLLASRALLVGVGGLGSPVALYLAAAGVGTLGIVDPDVVEESNLQRQVLHDAEHLGRLKVDSAAEAIGRLNPDVAVVRYPVRLEAGNALEIMGGYDIVVDGTDSFPARYLMNDAALRLRLPVVHGAVFRFEGQATVLLPYQGPCYRCLFPEPPPPGLSPSCAEAGVLGVLPGIIGSIQAAEALKLLLGIGTSLAGRLLTYDALAQEWLTLRVRRDPACPACADESRVPALVDYDDTCRPAGRVPR
jgi:molybdopterin/thiamine biosynthesis adenylyltransferase/rhodanese-related sulfurtransferase/molybdopterin converting factor small subunit